MMYHLAVVCSVLAWVCSVQAAPIKLNLTKLSYHEARRMSFAPDTRRYQPSNEADVPLDNFLDAQVR